MSRTDSPIRAEIVGTNTATIDDITVKSRTPISRCAAR